MNLRSAKFQGLFGFILSIISWVIPMGVVLSLAAIVFGLVGLYRNKTKDKLVTSFSLAAILLGIAGRIIYAFETNKEVNIAVIIGIVSAVAAIFILYRNKNV